MQDDGAQGADDVEAGLRRVRTRLVVSAGPKGLDRTAGGVRHRAAAAEQGDVVPGACYQEDHDGNGKGGYDDCRRNARLADRGRGRGGVAGLVRESRSCQVLAASAASRYAYVDVSRAGRDLVEVAGGGRRRPGRGNASRVGELRRCQRVVPQAAGHCRCQGAGVRRRRVGRPQA